MKILLTGGAGFIGSHISRELIKFGHKVLIMDNLSTGKEENIPPAAELERCDIRNTKAADGIFSSFKPDLVNHHAAQADVRISAEDPAHDAEINILGSLNLLALCSEHGVKRFVFASTGAVYGDVRNPPVDERSAKHPQSPYGMAKLCVENYLRFFKSRRGVEFTSLRYSNVYGERQDTERKNGIVAILCGNQKTNRETTIFGDGNQTRDYVHCSDVARANALCIEKPGGFFNISTGNETSVNEIIAGLSAVSGKKVKIKKTARKNDDISRIALDNSHARKTFGWNPEVNLNEGIAKTWRFVNSG